MSVVCVELNEQDETAPTHTFHLAEGRPSKHATHTQSARTKLKEGFERLRFWFPRRSVHNQTVVSNTMVVALPLVASTCVALVVGPGGADVQMAGGLAGASRVPHPAGGRGAMPTQRTARQQLQMNFGGHGKPPGSEATNSGAQNRRGAQGAARAESKGLTIGPGGDYVFAGFTDFTKRDEEHVPVHMRGGLTWPGLDVPPGSPLSPPGSEHGDRMGVQTGTHAAATANWYNDQINGNVVSAGARPRLSASGAGVAGGAGGAGRRRRRRGAAAAATAGSGAVDTDGGGCAVSEAPHCLVRRGCVRVHPGPRDACGGRVCIPGECRGW